MLSYQGAGRSLNHVHSIARITWFVNCLLHTVTMLFRDDMCECGYQRENRGPKSSLTQRYIGNTRGLNLVVVLIVSCALSPNGLAVNLTKERSIPIND